MSHCKHRIMDKCKKDDRPCIYNPGCFEPEEKKPMTNADRIRAMSDEELAVVITCPYDMEHPLCIQSPLCVDCCLKWLQQPAEEVNNGKDG